MRFRVLLREAVNGYEISVPGLPCCRSSGKTEVEAVDNIKRAIAEHLMPTETAGGTIREVDVPLAPAQNDHDLLMMACELTGTDDTEAVVREALLALIARESARRLAELGGTEPLSKAPRRRRPVTP